MNTADRDSLDTLADMIAGHVCAVTHMLADLYGTLPGPDQRLEAVSRSLLANMDAFDGADDAIPPALRTVENVRRLVRGV